MTNITSYASKNAAAVLEQVKAHIQELEGITNWQQLYGQRRIIEKGYSGKIFVFRIAEVCEELSIFDWWNETLSLSQLKQMKRFLEQAIKLGFTGYVCFKVGATGCSHGMWAHTEETTNGYSPKTGKVLHHSFVSNENYWDMAIDDEWMTSKYPDHGYRWTLAEVKEELSKTSKNEVEVLN